MYKQKFYSALKDIFVGEKIEGESGFVNLMQLKSIYYDNIENKLKKKIEESVSSKSEEKEIYEKLYTFFESYLNETGTPFFNNTQIHKNIYEKVYSDKDDVSLFWKTKDLYYIKSEHNYKSMSISKKGFKFNFDVSSLNHKQNNTKEDIEFYLVKADKENKILKFKVKYQQNNDYKKLKEILGINKTTKLQDFIIEKFNNSEDYPEIRLIKNDLDIMNDNLTKTLRRKMLDIRTKTNTIPEQIVIEFAAVGLDDIFEYLKRMDFDIDKEVLVEVFRLYMKQNKIDYFIHKNPEKFLKEQFKLYLFNYIYENDINLEGEGLKRAVQLNKLKQIGFEVIKYIARFEKELKAIWEKPKFVRKSEYVITLDRLDINLVEKLINSNNIQEQIQEWEKLGMIDENINLNDIVSGNKIKNKYKHLTIDTKYFPEHKYKILNSFDNLDDQLDGWVIHSENFQALNTILPKFKSSIDAIYIDPPYNSKSTEIYYINNYKHSSWLSLMYDRLSLGKLFLTKRGSLINAIDENEQERLGLMLNNIFENYNKVCVTIVHNPRGTQGNNFSYNNDYSYFVFPKKDTLIMEKKIPKSEWEYSNLRVWGGESKRETGKNVFYPIYVKDDKIVKIGDVPPDDFHPGKQCIKKENGILEVWPIDKKGIERKWRYVKKTLLDKLDAIKIKRKKDEVQIHIAKTHEKFKTTWYDSKYDASTYGTRLLTNMGLKDAMFPKSLYTVKDCLYAVTGDNKNSIILDFFAGTGTTAHAVLDLNKDGGKRKFILVEMDNYVNKYIIPRLKKIAFSYEWKNGKPLDLKGPGIFFKYYELEQYEDTIKKAKYKEIDEDIKKYTFMANDKLLDALEIDFENENIKIKFENLYTDIDIAETLSNILGKKIKKLNDKRVIFEDGMEIKFDEMTFEKYPFVKPLIWWGENIDNDK